nr:MAG TPA: hypothetical protein [Caudoviricetes sp.]
MNEDIIFSITLHAAKVSLENTLHCTRFFVNKIRSHILNYCRESEFIVPNPCFNSKTTVAGSTPPKVDKRN